MTSIIKYQKITDEFTVHQLREPDYAADAERCTELCTIDGITYVAVPDTVILPDDQPALITVEVVTLSDELRTQIKAISPHVRLIDQRVVEKIREIYSLTDEIKMIWKAAGADVDAYRTYVAECVAEGQSSKLGLGL